MAHHSLSGIAMMAVLCHLCAFSSIFDIYFRSPIINGLEPVLPPPGAEAKRVVLVVGDGCRADMFFDEEIWRDHSSSQGNYVKGGWIRGKILKGKASWGVSHTRVPTESRPCHASLLGGIYEDPSAITKGWQANPVEFDTIINASSAAFAFGSPDVIPLFAKGLEHVTADVYPAEWEDFAAGCHSKEMGCKRLDEWVINRLESLFRQAKSDGSLKAKLNQDRVVIFLHLLGLDMNGHAHRPNSAQYKDNIRYVDYGVQRIENMVDKFFGDKKTAYVFTADHGMSNKGSHGDGEPECTQTPLVAWGAGVRQSAIVAGGMAAPGHYGDKVVPQSPETWGQLKTVERKDIEQAQLAPLFACLIGTHVPANNIGIVPLSYLQSPPSSQRNARLLLANAKQILRQLDAKAELKKETSLSIFFYPYPPSRGSALKASADSIEELISRGKAVEAQDKCMDLISVALKGLDYYNTYDRSFLQSIIVAAYLGGMACLLLFSRTTYLSASAHEDEVVAYTPSRTALCTFAAAMLLLYAQNSPFQYSLYVALAVYLWDQVAQEGWGSLRDVLSLVSDGNDLQVWILRAGSFVLLELMIIGYFNRLAYTPCHLLLAVGGYFLPLQMEGSSSLRWTWVLGCLFSSSFTLLSVEHGDDMKLVYCGGLLLVLASIAAEISARTTGEKDIAVVFTAQAYMCLLAVLSLALSISQLEAQAGLPFLLWGLNWLLFISSLAAPFIAMHRTRYWGYRLCSLYVGWGLPYMMLSVNYETLFYCSLCLQLFVWVIFEREMLPSRHATGLSFRRDVCTALIVLFFVNASFFGTGNIASVSSFELKSVYRFMAVFNPYLMGGMLLFKMALPFVLVVATFSTVCALENIPRAAVLCLLLVFADIKSLHFFFFIKTEGSWKDIGQSISMFGITNFVIVMIMIIFVSVSGIGNGALYKEKRLR